MLWPDSSFARTWAFRAGIFMLGKVPLKAMVEGGNGLAEALLELGRLGQAPVPCDMPQQEQQVVDGVLPAPLRVTPIAARGRRGAAPEHRIESRRLQRGRREVQEVLRVRHMRSRVRRGRVLDARGRTRRRDPCGG